MAFHQVRKLFSTILFLALDRPGGSLRPSVITYQARIDGRQ